MSATKDGNEVKGRISGVLKTVEDCYEEANLAGTRPADDTATAIVETVAAAIKLQVRLESLENSILYVAKIIPQLLESDLPVTREYIDEIHTQLYSRKMLLPAFQVYEHDTGSVTVTPDEVRAELELLSSNKTLMPDAMHLLIYLMDHPVIEVDGDLLNEFIQKCIGFDERIGIDKYEPIQELGLALVNRMKFDASGNTDFGIDGFGDDDFKHVIAVCVAHEQYEVAGQIALAARNRGWRGMTDVQIGDRILEPYYLASVPSLSNRDVYDPLKRSFSDPNKFEDENLMHPYGKSLKLLASAMLAMPLVDREYIENLFEMKRPAGIEDKVMESYQHLIRVPMIQHEAEHVHIDELMMWVTMVAESGCGYQGGLIAAAGVDAGLFNKAQFETCLSKVGDYGKMPLLCAAIRNNSFVNKEIVKQYVVESNVTWFMTDTIIAAFEAGMTFDPADVERWVSRCRLSSLRTQIAGVRLAKVALAHDVKLSPEFIASFTKSCVDEKFTWLAVDLALAARDAGIQLDDTEVEEWREACFHTDNFRKADAIESTIALIEVYRARPEYAQDPGMNGKVKEAFDRVMQQRETAGITDATPVAKAQKKVAKLLSGTGTTNLVGKTALRS
jgi:hypothetical protein